MPNVQPSNYGYCQTQSRFIQVLDMGFLESDPPSSAYPEGCSGWSTCNHYFGDGEALLSAVNLAKHSHTTERRSGHLHHILPGLMCSATKVETALPPLMANRVYNIVYYRQIAGLMVTTSALSYSRELSRTSLRA